VLQMVPNFALYYRQAVARLEALVIRDTDRARDEIRGFVGERIRCGPRPRATTFRRT